MKKNKKVIMIIGSIIITIVSIIIVAIYASKNFVSSYKRQVLTEDNFTEIMDKAETELDEDEMYYLSYITLKNLFMPDNLYGNTVNELIKKGKNEMKRDGYTVEKYKKELNSLNNSTENSNSDEEESVSHRVIEINNEFVIGIWNDLFCNVSHYLEYGKDSVGQEFDFEDAMKKADKIMSKKDEYNEYISNLGNEYNELKDLWNKILPEAEKLYNKLKNERPRAMDKTYEFDVELYREYMYDFGELAYEIDK